MCVVNILFYCSEMDYFIVVDILFYCVESSNRFTAAACV